MVEKGGQPRGEVERPRVLLSWGWWVGEMGECVAGDGVRTVVSIFKVSVELIQFICKSQACNLSEPLPDRTRVIS